MGIGTDEKAQRAERLRLNSWKEVAAHLQRTVRTVQRWERQEDLPVRRHQHARGATIFAYTDELTAWSAQRLLTRSMQDNSGSTPVKLAVLPFEEALGTDAHVFLGAGLAESLVVRFTRLRNLQVVSTESVLRLRDQGLASANIGHRLGVDYVVEGSLRRAADRVRVTAALLRTTDSVYIWSKKYNKPWNAVFALEERIADDVAQEVRGALSLKEDQVRPGTSCLEAYEALLKGRHATRQFSNRREEAYYVEAQRFLAKALELDPGYAEAISEAGYLGYLLWETTGDPACLRESETKLRRSLDLYPANADAHFVLGHCAIFRLESDRALEHAKLALRVAPHAARSRLMRSSALGIKGFWEEAEEAARRAIAADPLYICPQADDAVLLALLGRHRQAVTRAEEALHIEPGSPLAVNALATAHILEADLESSAKLFEGMLAGVPEQHKPLFEIGLAFVAAAKGQVNYARWVRDRYRGTEIASSLYAMHLYAFLCSLTGDLEAAAELISQHPYLGHYRAMISLWPLWPLRRSKMFCELLEERYEKWRRDLAVLGPQISRRPPKLPDPERFLSLPLKLPTGLDDQPSASIVGRPAPDTARPPSSPADKPGSR